MKILLHSPLHPSYWIYLMETMPEHQWFIEPADDFQEGSIPRDHLKYKIVPKETIEKFDVQIICLQASSDKYRILEQFKCPVVWVEFWNVKMPDLKIKYPLISAIHSASNAEYPNISYTYVPPSKYLWNESWIGDIKKVFIPTGQTLENLEKVPHGRFGNQLFNFISKFKEAGIELDVIENQTRTIPFKEWKNKFIHNRVLFDFPTKFSSFITLEALTIGMPVVVPDRDEFPLVVRNNLDGFSKWTDKEIIEILDKFLNDKSFAKKWSVNSKARGQEILQVNQTRDTFNKAFEKAIQLYNASNKPFQLSNVKTENEISPWKEYRKRKYPKLEQSKRMNSFRERKK